MNESPDTPSHEQRMYWQELVLTKIDECYVRRYARDYTRSLRRWKTGTTVIRTITSTGSIGAWLIWKKYTFVWAFLIAASQVAEALRGIFPIYKRQRALSQWSRMLNRIFVEAQRDWDNIAGGEYTNAQIRKRLHHLRSRKERTQNYVPDGLSESDQLFSEAERETARFFGRRYYVSEE